MDQESENGDSAALLSQRRGTTASVHSYKHPQRTSPGLEEEEGLSVRAPSEKETTFAEVAETANPSAVSALKKPPPQLKLDMDSKDLPSDSGLKGFLKGSDPISPIEKDRQDKPGRKKTNSRFEKHETSSSSAFDEPAAERPGN